MSSCAYLVYLLLVSICCALDDKVNTDKLEKASENFSACGEVHIEKEFTLKSPENYSSNLTCYYLLKGPQCPSYYRFQFLNFSLDGSEGCLKEKFVIGHQDVLCGDHNETKTYFANTGSLHLRFETSEGSSGKGYWIEVRRMPCEKVLEAATEDSTTRDLGKTTTLGNTDNSIRALKPRIFLPEAEKKTAHCCGTIYSSKNFIITSPNFPYSLNRRSDCSFLIHKTNSNICRLRLNFHFFWLGYTDRNNCPHGALEIDGKYICGCNSNLKLTTTFGNSNIKLLRFRSDGKYQSFNTGFVLEVTQDECPKKYSPDDNSEISNIRSDQYHFYNDQINRVAWPTSSENFIEKLQLINERTEILDDTEGVIFRDKPKVTKSIYVFAPPEYSVVPSLSFNKEGTTYLDTSSISTVVINSNYYQCLNWNQMQLNILFERFGKKLECPKEEENMGKEMESRKCVDLSYVNGYFRSPGYPCFYPGNLNICYRIKKQPGYCKIKVFVQDFQIENSFNCMKDYFLLANGEKYCGNGLNKASWIIELGNKDHEDMIFVTDGYYCSRGFSGVYQQIACQDDFPSPSVEITTQTIITTTPVNEYCDRNIREKFFTIEIEGNHEKCTFGIRRYSKDVCKINFYFEKFDLVCAVESLIIDGTMYCGHLTGRAIKVNANNSSLNIVYRSTLKNKYDDLRLKIRGEQISDDCLILEDPEVQRLIVSEKPKNTYLPPENSIEIDDHIHIDSKYLVAFVNKNFKDICGIVSNSTTKELPSSFCEILTKDHNATKCLPLPPKILSDVPYETNKVGVELSDKKFLKNLPQFDINEIDCDNLPL